MPQKEVLPEWRICEMTKKIEHERKGCYVVPTGKGSDFVAICPNKKPIFVEVKQGCGSLTELQKKTMKEVIESGFEYKIERCSCSKKIKEHKVTH
jgi:hypothetical protein